jgi:hypothetical protein
MVIRYAVAQDCESTETLPTVKHFLERSVKSASLLPYMKLTQVRDTLVSCVRRSQSTILHIAADYKNLTVRAPTSDYIYYSCLLRVLNFVRPRPRNQLVL